MRTAITILAVCFAVSVSAQSPVPGSLCEGVVPASVEDFWNKWDSADLVLYALPILSEYSTIGNVVVATHAPPPASETFQLRTFQVWKGPETIPQTEVSTSWGFSLWDCGNPPGYCVYNPESCSLMVEKGVSQVFFLRMVGGKWETFTSFGTGVYDLSWVETEVGEPVSVEARSWGSIKAYYR